MVSLFYLLFKKQQINHHTTKLNPQRTSKKETFVISTAHILTILETKVEIEASNSKRSRTKSKESTKPVLEISSTVES